MSTKTALAYGVITHYEGFVSEWYTCPAGIQTIGYGRTTGSMEPTTIDKERDWLLNEINRVDLFINYKVEPKCTPEQMAAMISFIYNVGQTAFSNSTFLKRLNNDEFRLAGNELLRWSKAGNNVLPGLVKRRMTEYLLFTNKELRLF